MTNFTIDKENKQVVITRVFDAPRMMVWAAVTDPTLIPLWWGPKNRPTVVEKFEPRPGGEWRFLHSDDNGQQFGFHGVTTEIVPFTRIVQTFNFEGIPPGHEMVQTMTLEDHEGIMKTKLTQTAQYQNIEDLEGMVGSGMESGLNESMDRLAELTKAKKKLTITRLLDAPREMVFKAWTDPKLVAEWWGPKMFTSPVCEIDARVGGAIRIGMQGPDRNISYMNGTFKELVPPERIVFISTVSFNGESNEPDMENLNTVTLLDKNGKTEMTVDIKVLRSTPAANVPLSGMEMGWQQTLEKLATFIEKK